MTKPQRNPIIESLKDRIARDPFSRAFLQLAEEYRRLGRFKEAIEVCLEGLGRHPTYHTARISLGRTYMEAGDLENARRAFSDVLELQPENHLAGKLLAEVQKKMGDVRGAAETYRAILEQYPNDREVEGLPRQVPGGSATTLTTPSPAVPALPAPRAVAAAAPAPPARDPAPDFRVEDLGVAGFPAAGEMGVSGGPPPAPSAGAAAPVEEDGED